MVVHVTHVSGTPYAADFSFNVNLSCDPKSCGPGGTRTGSMVGDSQATFAVTSVAQVIPSGPVTPTAYVSGSCQINPAGGLSNGGSLAVIGSWSRRYVLTHPARLPWGREQR